ncbi:methyltransferase [Streptomyces sp. NPDC056534]|uniref:methyltransferase n=1 Tax=Streptomyces sp. NPDC056534 TaxID=3345857 RepID=UPI0036C73D28
MSRESRVPPNQGGYSPVRAEDAAEVMDLLLGFVKTQSVNTAIKLGIPDLVAQGPVTSETVARHCGTDVHSTSRLLRCLASIGVLDETKNHEFMATRISSAILSSQPGSIAAYVRFVADYTFTSASHIDAIMTSGSSGDAFLQANGKSFFELLATDPQAGLMFDSAMAVTSTGFREGFLEYDWSKVSHVIDVGGGSGALLTSLLSRYPHLRGTLCEQAHVLEEANSVLSAAQVEDRCTLKVCDFFKEIPSGGDVYILARVLHDWDDTKASAILGRVYDAMTADGRMLIADQVLSDSPGSHWSKVYNLFITLLLSGNERTEGDWRALLSDSKFTLNRIRKAGWRSEILECTPQKG